MRLILSIFMASMLFSCSEEHEQSDSVFEVEKEEDYSHLPFEDRVKLHVQSQLQIPGNENYSLKIHKEQLTVDGIEDAIITVNRLEYAMKKAKDSNRLAKAASMDFLGAYNVLFYYDSELDKITPPLTFNSTPYREIKVSFENISSTAFKDAIIDYPIRNSEFRVFLPIMNNAPKTVLQWKVYDGWGTEELEAYCFEYAKGSNSEFKDIIVKRAKMKNIERGDNYNTIKPEITCGTEVTDYFFFNPTDGKYYRKN